MPFLEFDLRLFIFLYHRVKVEISKAQVSVMQKKKKQNIASLAGENARNCNQIPTRNKQNDKEVALGYDRLEELTYHKPTHKVCLMC